MINRRQRLEFALSILPYDHKTVKLSPAQQKVEDIIARLRIDDSSIGEESDDERARKAKAFALETMEQIESAENISPKPKQVLSTLATLTLAAEKLLKTQCKVEEQEAEEEAEEVAVEEGNTEDHDGFECNSEWIDEEAALDKIDCQELLENSIQAVNEARINLLQRWERSKRTALDLLTTEIEKVQGMDRAYSQKMTQFDLFRDGTDELNTSTPVTNDDDEDKENASEIEPESKQQNSTELPDDADDEEYVPHNTGNREKGKRRKKPVTSTPNAKRKCPQFEFDQDASSPMVTIGPNGTQISRACLRAINWETSGPAITRKLLCEIFDRATLAYHTLTGKPSPAFKDCARPSKQQLDPHKVADLVYLMTNKLEMTPREVRTAITTKCADENKMLRNRLQKDQKRARKII